MADLNINVDRWVKAEIKGNPYCPSCNTLLIISLSGWSGYLVAFCPTCKSYWVPRWQQDEAMEKKVDGIFVGVKEDADL